MNKYRVPIAAIARNSLAKAFFLSFIGLFAPVNAHSEQKLYFVHSDHLGTPQILTDENQTVVWKARYTPFGEATVDSDPDGDSIEIEFNLRFPGQYYDKETGLSYNINRYYNSAFGRYTQSDPIGLAGGINTYGYALQNPIIFTDPNGLKTVPCPPGTVAPSVPCYITTPDGSGNNDGPYPPNYCPTGDCAVYPANNPGGLVPAPSSPEAKCKFNCNLILGLICGPIAGATTETGPGAAAAYLACRAAVYVPCAEACKKDDEECKLEE